VTGKGRAISNTLPCPSQSTGDSNALFAMQNLSSRPPITSVTHVRIGSHEGGTEGKSQG